MNKPEKSYSVTELAKKLELPYYTTLRKVKKGHFPGAFKVGHGWVIPAKGIK